jgi:hypothetical protein
MAGQEMRASYIWLLVPMCFHESDRSETPYGWKWVRGLVKSLFEFIKKLVDDQCSQHKGMCF